jgi:hypothetical protein
LAIADSLRVKLVPLRATSVRFMGWSLLEKLPEGEFCRIGYTSQKIKTAATETIKITTTAKTFLGIRRVTTDF